MAAIRKRGAPFGNRNAVKHGFYSKTLNPADRSDLNLAADIVGVDEEIALLRLEIKKALSGGSVASLVPLAKAALALEKLVRARHLIFVEKRHTLELAVENVLRDVLLPLTDDDSTSTIPRHVPRRDGLDDNQ